MADVWSAFAKSRTVYATVKRPNAAGPRDRANKTIVTKLDPEINAWSARPQNCAGAAFNPLLSNWVIARPVLSDDTRILRLPTAALIETSCVHPPDELGGDSVPGKLVTRQRDGI